MSAVSTKVLGSKYTIVSMIALDKMVVLRSMQVKGMFSLKSLLNTSRDMRHKKKVVTSMVDKKGASMIFGCAWSASDSRYKARGRTLKLITGDTVSRNKTGHINMSRISRKRLTMCEFS